MSNPNIAVLGLKHGWKFVDALYHRADSVGGNLIAICSRTLLDYQPPRIPDPKIQNVKFYNNYIKLMDELKDELDGIIVALPNDLHLDATREAAKRNIAVLLEKPIANTVEESKEIAEIVEKSEIKFMVGHHRRFSAKMNIAKKIIEDGRLGEIAGVNVVWAAKKPDEYFDVKWRVTEGIGGPLLINAIHDIDDLRYTIGEIDMVQAYINNSVRGNEVEDVAAAIFKFENGAIASYFISDGVTSNMFYETCAKEDPFFFPSDSNCYFFYGQKGCLEFPSMKILSYDSVHGEGWHKPYKCEVVPVDRVNPIDEETKHFCDMIKGKEKSKVTAEDAIKSLRVIEAIRESSQKGKAIYL
jgi:predicted dehydrogenase